MHDATLPVLYEDNHLLAVCKPANLPTQGAPAGKASLVTIAKRYVKHKYNKPGNVYLGVVSRLDGPVTGVVVLARTSKAAARLTDQFRRGEVEKIYWAIVDGRLKPASSNCANWLRKDERRRKMMVVRRRAPGAVEAELSYRTLNQTTDTSHVEIRLHTGRKHQIRVQLAHLGHPILGDAKYGSRASFPRGIALHARRLVLSHPVRGTPLELVAPIPESWHDYGFASDDS